MIFLASIFWIIGRYSNNTEAFIKQINIECKGNSLKERQGCLESKIITYVNKNPTRIKKLFDDIWKSLETGELPDDARVFSPMIHDAGMLLVSKGMTTTEAVKICNTNFRGACIHGVIMEHIDNTYKNINIETVVQECESLKNKTDINVFENCIHAVGHEFAARTKGTLNEILRSCSAVPTAFIDNCLYGVFMEYSKGEAGRGNSHHSEEPVGKKNLDCNVVDDSFKKVCYISSGFYRQYEFDSESWENSYRFCENTPNKYRQDCFNGVGGALLFSNAYTTERATAVCKSLSKDIQNHCLNSF